MNKTTMHKAVMSCFLLLSLLTTNSATAEKIYKWVDEIGTTHYSSKPPLIETDTEILTTPDEPDEMLQEPTTQEPDLTDTETTPSTTVSQDSSPVSKTQNPEVVEYCKELTENLSVLKGGDRIRLKKDDGSFEILGYKGKEREIKSVIEKMQKYCQ